MVFFLSVTFHSKTKRAKIRDALIPILVSGIILILCSFIHSRKILQDQYPVPCDLSLVHGVVLKITWHRMTVI